MTLIFEIAGGIVLAVAIIALVVAFRESLVIALTGLICLAACAVVVAIFYGICGSWENAALVAVVLGALAGAGWLIEFFNSHEKYGTKFRAVGNSISVSVIISTFVSLIIWLPLSILSENWIRIPYQYILIMPAIFTFALSARFVYQSALQNEPGAARDRSA